MATKRATTSRKPKTGWLYYLDEYKSKKWVEDPEAKYYILRKEALSNWEEMSDTLKAQYEKLAKNQFEEEQATPKSYRSAFSYFIATYDRPTLLTVAQQNKLINDEWDKMSEEARAPFKEMVEKAIKVTAEGELLQEELSALKDLHLCQTVPAKSKFNWNGSSSLKQDQQPDDSLADTSSPEAKFIKADTQWTEKVTNEQHVKRRGRPPKNGQHVKRRGRPPKNGLRSRATTKARSKSTDQEACKSPVIFAT